MAELQDEIIRYQNEVRAQDEQLAKAAREDFWFNVIVWSLISTIPIGFITMAFGALVVGMVFICVGIGSMLLMVLGALMAAG